MQEGRPTKYIPAYNKQALKLCLLGATDKEIADFFEVNIDTITEWKKTYPKFSESIRAGKTKADAEVAHRLFTRAIGYKYQEVTYEKIDSQEVLVSTPAGEIKEPAYRKKIITKEMAPDTTAAIFFLKNRQKKYWRDKQEIGFTDPDGNDVVHIFQLPDNGRDPVMIGMKKAN